MALLVALRTVVVPTDTPDWAVTTKPFCKAVVALASSLISTSMVASPLALVLTTAPVLLTKPESVGTLKLTCAFGTTAPFLSIASAVTLTFEPKAN